RYTPSTASSERVIFSQVFGPFDMLQSSRGTRHFWRLTTRVYTPNTSLNPENSDSWTWRALFRSLSLADEHIVSRALCIVLLCGEVLTGSQKFPSNSGRVSGRYLTFRGAAAPLLRRRSLQDLSYGPSIRYKTQGRSRTLHDEGFGRAAHGSPTKNQELNEGWNIDTSASAASTIRWNTQRTSMQRLA
ncbi:hypothetical protein EIP91_010614, partial [Steccherinum ochraceum]